MAERSHRKKMDHDGGDVGRILFYRPIFSTFLEETQVKEWVKGSEAKRLGQVILVDTTSAKQPIYLCEIKYDYKGILFTHKDTACGWTAYPPLSALGENAGKPEFKYGEIPDPKPGFKDVVLTEGLKWKFIFPRMGDDPICNDGIWTYCSLPC